MEQSGDGVISASEFRSLLYDFGVYLNDEQLKFALQSIDLDGTGEISYNEFSEWWRKGNERFSQLQLTDEQLERRRQFSEIFRKYDADQSGVISRQEFKALYTDLVQYGLTTKTEDQCLAELDSNGDNSIQLMEFVNWLEAKKAAKA